MPRLGRRDVMRLAGTIALGELIACARPRSQAGAPSAATAGNEATNEFVELRASYETLMAQHGEHEWSRYAGQTAGNDAESATRLGELRKREQSVVTRAHELAAKKPPALDARETELWARAARALPLLADPAASELADRLEATINDFEFVHEGRKLSRSDLRLMAESQDEAQRRLQYVLWGKLHERAAPIARELLRRRRALGVTHAGGDFYAAMLALRGVDADALRGLLDGLERRTRSALERARKRARQVLKLARVAPYDQALLMKSLGDYENASFPANAALPFAKRVFGALGVDFERPKLRIDVRDFAFGGQCISLRVPDDVRLVVNPTPGARFYSNLMHELGHAFAATRTRETNPVFKSYEWIAGLNEPGYDEGLAEVFGQVLDEAAIVARFLPGLSAEEREQALRGHTQAGVISLAGRHSAIAFEREALRDPEQDLDALERRLQRELQGLDVSDDLPPTWAANALLGSYPVYVQSYLLATLFSHQLRAALRERFGPDWIKPEAAKFLEENVVFDAAKTTIDQKLVRATGAPLSADAYLSWLGKG